MKFISIKELPFKLETFYDKDDNLITPKKSERFQLGLFDHLLNPSEVSVFYDLNTIDINFPENETKCLNFISEIFRNTSSEVFIELEQEALTNSTLINILNCLDFEDKTIWIDFIKLLHNSDSKVLKIESEKELRTFFKLTTREAFFSIFHFENGKVNLVGNFDLFWTNYKWEL